LKINGANLTAMVRHAPVNQPATDQIIPKYPNAKYCMITAISADGNVSQLGIFRERKSVIVPIRTVIKQTILSGVASVSN
jgi:hypothetical protein